jgi:hypothetical protein
MGKVYATLEPPLAEFVRAQRVFFVATAPLAGDGHVNCSPKGLDTFAILDPSTVAYLDFTGSGVETIAHVRENGRITLLFCAFDGPPKIVRLYGRGEVLPHGTAAYDALRPRFGGVGGGRSIIRVHLTRVADSCGYGVPRLEFVGDRDQLGEWARRKGPEGVRRYERDHNAASIDGLPGLDDA